jgi:hypothetical protein
MDCGPRCFVTCEERAVRAPQPRVRARSTQRSISRGALADARAPPFGPEAERMIKACQWLHPKRAARFEQVARAFDHLQLTLVTQLLEGLSIQRQHLAVATADDERTARSHAAE